MLVSRQVILFAMLFANPVRMRGLVVQFSGALMIFVVGAVVVTR